MRPRAKRIAPPNVNTISVFLTVRSVRDAVEYYKTVFAATTVGPVISEERAGPVRFAQLTIGDSTVMMTEEVPGMSYRSPATLGGTPITLWVYVDEPDHVYRKAMANGSQSIAPMRDANSGTRFGQFRDPFGYIWHVANHPVAS